MATAHRLATLAVYICHNVNITKGGVIAAGDGTCFMFHKSMHIKSQHYTRLTHWHLKDQLEVMTNMQQSGSLDRPT